MVSFECYSLEWEEGIILFLTFCRGRSEKIAISWYVRQYDTEQFVHNGSCMMDGFENDGFERLLESKNLKTVMNSGKALSLRPENKVLFETS